MFYCFDEGSFDPRVPLLPWFVDACQEAPTVVPPLVTVEHWWTNPAIWFWIGVVAGFVIVEVWARFGKKHQSPSQWIQKQGREHPWLKPLGTAIFLYLIYHFFYPG